jgi:predicted AlkP superfamily pyrophosphatase or phosphodiesterase
MKTNARAPRATGVALGLAASTLGAMAHAAPAKPARQRVVVMVWDGLRPDSTIRSTRRTSTR